MIMANDTQELWSHLLNIAEVSKKIIERLDISEDSYINKSKIMNLAYYAGLLHDIGKIDPIFQKYLNDKTTTSFNPNGVHIEKVDPKSKFSFENHPRHNEISWFITTELFDKKSFNLNNTEFEILNNVILWHHSSPIRKEKFESSHILAALKKNKNEVIKNLEKTLLDIKLECDQEDIEDIFNAVNKPISKYKLFFNDKALKDIDTIKQDIKKESISSLIRSVVTTADRYVSASKSKTNIEEILDNIFEENKYSEFKQAVEKMEKEFHPNTERSNIQEKASKELSKINIQGEVAILNAPAGSGKTKVSLQWAKNNNANKIYYIVPRTIIAEEIFDEFKNKYLKKSASYELITGDKKIKWDGKKEVIMEEEYEFYKSDIVITTIDQLIKTTTTHKNISILQDIIQSHVIFDEFHEYYQMSGFDLLFAEFIRIKAAFKNPKTLLMSATPNFFMLDVLLDIYDNSSSNMVTFDTSNIKDYNLIYSLYEEDLALPSQESLFVLKEDNKYSKNKNLDNIEINKNPFLKLWDDKKTIIISNTATMAQKSFILNNENEDSLLAHSKYKQEDKKDILLNIKNNFKNIDNGNKILRAGPIVQASLNITSERLITEITTAEKIIQRLGRLNRFGEDFVGDFIIAIPNKALNEKIKMKSSSLSLLKSNNEKDSSIHWINFLLSRIKKSEKGSIFKLKDIYGIYKDFYKDKETIRIMNEELLSSLINSYKNISYNILDPVDIIGYRPKKNNDKKTLSKNSLRGKNFNTKMAVYDLNCDSLELTNNYAENISLSKQLILLYDENYFFVKDTIKKSDIICKDLDKKILSLIKKAKKQKSEKYDKFVLDLSRGEDFNIFTSLSREHLDSFNKIENEEESYIYIKTDKQVVGYLKLKQLYK